MCIVLCSFVRECGECLNYADGVCVFILSVHNPVSIVCFGLHVQYVCAYADKMSLPKGHVYAVCFPYGVRGDKLAPGAALSSCELNAERHTLLSNSTVQRSVAK